MLLSMTNMQKRYGATIALHGVDLEIRAGEVHAVVGENGAGKSTLMKLLSGVVAPDAGKILLDGVPFRPANPRDAREQGIVMIYQELALADHLSVAENISLGTEPSRFGILKRGRMRTIAHQTLAELGYASLNPDVLVRDLPAATRQIVEMARAAAAGCRILVLDEPTSSLSHADTQRLFAFIRRLVAAGCAVVFISHILEDVKALAHRITILRDGQTVHTAEADALSETDMITHMAGRNVDNLYPRSSRAPGESLLEVRDLVTTARNTPVSFAVRRGEVLGIGGLVGSGRTELLRSIFGLDPVCSGDIRVAGRSGWAPPPIRLKQGVGMLSEDRRKEGLAVALSVADNLTLTRFGGKLGFFLPARQHQQARTWIETLGIRVQDSGQSVETLSGGNQQKVAMARLLHHEAEVLLLDEPTRGIDVASKARMYDIIDALATGDPSKGQPPRAVILVSSYIPELLGVCDRIAVMYRGQLSPAQPVDAWDAHKILLCATTGKDAA